MRNLRALVSLIFIVIGIIGIFLTIGDYNETRNMEFEYTVENEHIDTIFVKDRVALIEVLPTTGSDIVIAWEEDGNRKQDQVTIDEHGNQLEIKRKSSSTFLMIPTFNMKQKNMKIYIPKENVSSINIKNAVGSVLVRNVQVDELNIQTDVQKVDIINVQGNNIVATSSVGSITIEKSTGDIRASSKVGSVDIDLEEVTGDMDLSSDVGSVTLTIDERPENVSFFGSSEIGSVRIFGESGSSPVENAIYEVHLNTNVGKVEVRTRY